MRMSVVMVAWVAFLGLLASCGGQGGGGVGDVTDVVDAAATADTPQDTPSEIPEVGSPETLLDTLDVAPPDIPPEVSADTLDMVPELPPSACGDDCPPGFCDEESGWCEFCASDEDCPDPLQWCKDNRCEETSCLPGAQKCMDFETLLVCKDDGSGWTASSCGEGMACNAGECVPVVCEPEATQCDGYLIQECAPTGAGWISFACPPGKACLFGECVPIKNNLVVIFDTSGSMDDSVPCICPGVGCPSKPFPECEDKDCPATRIGLAKYVFRKLIASEEIQAVNMVITHFPMDVDSTSDGCDGGYYSGKSEITGDNDSHATLDWDWFDQNIQEILSVSFPLTIEEDNLVQAGIWFNNQESLAASEEPCSGGCPGGFCSGSVCWYHDDPELRADGGTPLAKSLFYAGELYRKMIYVQGRSCAVDADCANPNYFCVDGACHDPYRLCRTNMVLMLTDGMQSASLTNFFNPRVQAKRFRYGLCCATDEDCFEGSECTGAGDCGLYPHLNSLDGTEPDVIEGPCRLHAYNGEPIQVTTHVIDLSDGGGGELTNKQIADEGGGQYHHASQADPNILLMQMFEVLDFKLDLLSCVPEF